MTTTAPVLAPWQPRERSTAWRPWAPGMASQQGLQGLLEGARAGGYDRVMVCGQAPPPTWLLRMVPGWTGGAHYLDTDTPVGRFTHDATGHAVQLRRAAEWFGPTVTTPRDCAEAYDLLAGAWRRVMGGPLFDSPAATGMDGWLRCNPDTEQLPADLAELVRATSPQHRVELFPHEGPLPGFAYVDGRFQFASLLAELGTATGAHLYEDPVIAEHQAADLYARARFQVRATVPRHWDTLGVLMCPAGPDPGDGWRSPRTPGETFTTWCDGAELRLARLYGWQCDVLAALPFGKGRPLDQWRDRILRGREHLATPAPSRVHDAARAGLRSILLQTIGAFHSTGRTLTRVIDPTNYAGDGALEHRGHVWIVREHHALTGRAAAMTHPEISAQVWGRSHARVLESPTGGTRWAGAAQVELADIVGIRGDALYLTRNPQWPDDGKIGRLRLKGWLPGPLDPPRTLDELNRLRAAAEKASTL